MKTTNVIEQRGGKLKKKAETTLSDKPDHKFRSRYGDVRTTHEIRSGVWLFEALGDDNDWCRIGSDGGHITFIDFPGGPFISRGLDYFYFNEEFVADIIPPAGEEDSVWTIYTSKTQPNVRYDPGGNDHDAGDEHYDIE